MCLPAAFGMLLFWPWVGVENGMHINGKFMCVKKLPKINAVNTEYDEIFWGVFMEVFETVLRLVGGNDPVVWIFLAENAATESFAAARVNHKWHGFLVIGCEKLLKSSIASI